MIFVRFEHNFKLRAPFFITRSFFLQVSSVEVKKKKKEERNNIYNDVSGLGRVKRVPRIKWGWKNTIER